MSASPHRPDSMRKFRPPAPAGRERKTCRAPRSLSFSLCDTFPIPNPRLIALYALSHTTRFSLCMITPDQFRLAPYPKIPYPMHTLLLLLPVVKYRGPHSHPPNLSPPSHSFLRKKLLSEGRLPPSPNPPPTHTHTRNPHGRAGIDRHHPTPRTNPKEFDSGRMGLLGGF